MNLINLETLISRGPPGEGVIKRMRDEICREMNAAFDEINAVDGTPSVTPETLLKRKVQQSI